MAPVPEDPPQWPMPRFSIRIDDLAHPGAALFLGSVKPLEALQTAVRASLQHLYKSLDKAPTSNVDSITLTLRPMGGVAHTFGDADKHIHFSLDHIVNSKDRVKDEIMGVLVHEVVHCYQYDGNGTAPGGLIEGFADYVRMLANLSPPHWAKSFPPKLKYKRDGTPSSKGDHWDSGYERTAFFLRWLEKRYGDGTVRELNERLQDKYKRKRLWRDVTGRPIRKLWKIYCKDVGATEQDEGSDDDDESSVYDDAKDQDIDDDDDDELVLIDKPDC